METNVMQKVTVVGPNLPAQAKAELVVHAAGCADLKRGWIKNYTADAWDIDAPDLTTICDAVYPPDQFECESGEYLSEFHFAPCVTLPEKAG